MQIQTVQGKVVTLTPGKPTEFTATKSFQLPAPAGGLAPNIAQGGTMTFDGQVFSYAGDPPRPLPQFLGAIKAGWVTPSSEYTGASMGPVSAGIAVRPAEGGNPMDNKPKTMVTTAQAEEQEVGQIASHAAQVQHNNQQNYRRVVTAADQEGVAVRQLGSPDGRKNPTEVTPGSVGQAIRQANSVQVQPGQGKSREELMAEMSPEQRQAYINELEVRKASHGFLDQQVAISSPDTQGQVVANLQSSNGQKTQDGITSTVSTGGGIETVDAGGTGGEAEVTTTVVEGVKITNTNGPKKGQTVEGAKPAASLDGDPRRVIAKAICADFPDNYDFDASARKKIARLQADYDDRMDVIRAVAAAETDAEVKAKLIEEFPEAFG